VTEQSHGQLTGSIPAQPGEPGTPPAPGPWAEYLAAAQRLDAVRRAANNAAGEQQATAAVARQELSAVRAILVPQRARLIQEAGVPEAELRPTPTDVGIASGTVAGGPAAALAALQQARRAAEAAEGMLVAPRPTRQWRPWARNLLIYGPFAAAVLLAQIALYLVAPQGSVPTYALLCGLSMPVLAFALGWVTIGFVYGDEPGGVDRTPIVGAVACLVPVLLTCMGVGLAAFF
jgi:hypothetical protein